MTIGLEERARIARRNARIRKNRWVPSPLPFMMNTPGNPAGIWDGATMVGERYRRRVGRRQRDGLRPRRAASCDMPFLLRRRHRQCPSDLAGGEGTGWPPAWRDGDRAGQTLPSSTAACSSRTGRNRRRARLDGGARAAADATSMAIAIHRPGGRLVCITYSVSGSPVSRPAGPATGRHGWRPSLTAAGLRRLARR